MRHQAPMKPTRGAARTNSAGWLAFTLSSNLSCQGKLTAETELSDCLIFTYNKKHCLNKLIKGDVEIDTVSVTFYQKEDL